MKLARHLGIMATSAALVFGTAWLVANRAPTAPDTPAHGGVGGLAQPLQQVQDDAAFVTINTAKEGGNTQIDQQREEDITRRDDNLVPGRLVRSVGGRPVGRIVAIERGAESVVILRNEGVIALKPDHFAVVEDQLVALFTRDQIDENTKPVPEALRQWLAGRSNP